MSQIKFAGPLGARLSALGTISRISIETHIRHVLGRKLDPTWDANFETGIRFVRHQFTKAMTCGDIVRGRVIMDALQTETDDVYDVTQTDTAHPKGQWYTPRTRRSEATLLYCHGGGYSFHMAASRRFAAMLAHHCGAPLFAPDYRLTPEHPHPAQAEDALAAWHCVAGQTPPERIVVIGDSAGGHMALGLLQTLRREGAPQPALCIGLCPWTDIGARGQSLQGNDRYDLVQGWMALQFGRWLDPQGRFGREALSPIAQDYTGLAPLYLQAGGREVLRDMICDFAQVQIGHGARVLLDLWPDMPHDFQAFDRLKPSAAQALARIVQAVQGAVDGAAPLRPADHTVLHQGFGAMPPL